jgi:small basic protein (TIGR04137 family)
MTVSMHKSLIPPDKFGGHRSVFRRAEKVARLESEQKRKVEDSVFGLPKIRNIKMKQKKKAEEEAAETAAVPPGAEGAPASGAAPAAGTKPAAPAAKPAAETKKK